MIEAKRVPVIYLDKGNIPENWNRPQMKDNWNKTLELVYFT